MTNSPHYDAATKGTFLHNYLRAAEHMESPRSYDFWCGLWILSTLVGRSVVVNRPNAPVHLNLYTILCADAGTTRKSWSVNNAARVVHASEQKVLMVTGSTTVEGLQAQMAHVYMQDGPIPTAVCVSELVTLLGKENYTIGMPGLLTDFYDCPEERLVLRAGLAHPLLVKDVYVTFLSASTPAWLVRAVNPDVIEGGFTSRCLFIIEDRPKRLVAWPTRANDAPTIEQLAQQADYLTSQARRFSKIELHNAARELFVKWYEGRRLDTSDPFLNSFFAREDHHVLRVAALLSINDDLYCISKGHITHAIELITLHRDSAAHLFGSGKQLYRLYAGIEALRSILASAGSLGLSQTELTWKVGKTLSNKELLFLLEAMHELEMVQRFELPRRGKAGGRTRTIWRGTNRLLMRTANNALIERLTR